MQVLQEMVQVQRVVAQANRVMAEATLLGIREAQGFCEVPCQEDEGLESSGLHVEDVAVVLGTPGGELGAKGLSTPPTRVGGYCCDITPPKLEVCGHGSRTAAHSPLTQQAVPAFPTTCKGSVMAQVVAPEEVFRLVGKRRLSGRDRDCFLRWQGRLGPIRDEVALRAWGHDVEQAVAGVSQLAWGQE